MPTVQAQRERMIASLSRIETKMEQNDKDHNTIIERLTIQNGTVAKNRDEIAKNGKAIAKIIGYGAGVTFVLGLAISLVALFV